MSLSLTLERLCGLEDFVSNVRRLEWSSEEIQKLRKLVEEQAGLGKISRVLKRAPSAIIAKADEQGISLSPKV